MSARESTDFSRAAGAQPPGTRVAWVRVGLQRFESPGAASCRFAWLNAIPRSKSLRTNEIARRNGIDLDVDVPVPKALFESSLRFCRSCLEFHFHSDVFQLSAARRCPFHGEPLIETCPHCGEVGSLEYGGPSSPFVFSCCGHAASAREPQTVDAAMLDPDAIDAFARASEFIKCLDGLARHNRRELENRHRRFSARALTSVLARISGAGPVPHWCEPVQVLAAGGVRVSNLDAWLDQTADCQTRRLRGKTWLRPETAAAIFGGPISVLCSLDAALRARLRSICGHDSPRRLCYISEAPSLELPPDFCPACAAYELWKAHCSPIFELRDLMAAATAPLSREDVLRHASPWIKLPPDGIKSWAINLFVNACVSVDIGVRLARDDISEREARQRVTCGPLALEPQVWIDRRQLVMLSLLGPMRAGPWAPTFVDAERRLWFFGAPLESGWARLQSLLAHVGRGPMWDAPPQRSSGQVWQEEYWYSSLSRKAFWKSRVIRRHRFVQERFVR